MKISLSGEIKFYVDVDLMTVIDLRRLALVHYDLVCKGVAMEGGVLLRWEQDLTNRPREVWAGNKAWWPKATWRELDTLAKVCEQASLFFELHKDPEAHARVSAFAKSVGNALRESFQITKSWQHDFEG